MLGDGICVKILGEINNRPSTATEVSARFNESASTIWKKMHLLEEAELIAGSKRTGDAGKMTVVYHMLNHDLGPCTVKDLLDVLH